MLWYCISMVIIAWAGLSVFYITLSAIRECPTVGCKVVCMIVGLASYWFVFDLARLLLSMKA